MRSFRSVGRQTFFSLASLGLLLGMALPAFLPAFASADTITSRSIEMSSSAVKATGVTYKVTFTAVNAAAGFVLDFCSNTPLTGGGAGTCDAPTDMDASSVTTSTSGYTVAPITTTGEVGAVVTETAGITAGQTVTVELSGITNPTPVGTFYGRIVTYSTLPDPSVADNDTLTAGGAVAKDIGAVALATTNSFAVSAAVLESMTFCASSTTISENCSAGVSTPDLTLGQSTGGAYALSSSAVSTGNVYVQIGTNADHGAVVNLTSDAGACGGLVAQQGASSTTCISPATSADAYDNTSGKGKSFFGLMVDSATGTATSGDTSATGTFQPSGSYANNSDYLLNSAVTSTYGDQVLDTNGAIANDMNNELTFGASVDNVTAAGNYQATLGLIATGTF